MDERELVDLLALEDFTPVYKQADKIRKANVGDKVQIRGIIEFSNICKRRCVYCGLNCTNNDIHRYKMSYKEILDSAKEAAEAGYRTIVLQSGEDPNFEKEAFGELIREIKKLSVAITLSCGELDRRTLEYLKNQGADRYLLKHETSDPNLYRSLHPCGTLDERINCLKDIADLGYETGSGFMIGLPGQTLNTIAKDILLLKELNCKMAGIGPFISHPKTPLAGQPNGSTELTKRAVALTRIILPEANLPVTTSLGVINQQEKENAFSCGANVIMRKVTPDKYKESYEIYPAKLEKTQVKEDRRKLEEQIIALERVPV
ncbi:MAG: [FeFe] hydrogenase H-cluster radical SAM maturase HydE [Anaerovoracaceae bacterium]